MYLFIVCALMCLPLSVQQETDLKSILVREGDQTRLVADLRQEIREQREEFRAQREEHAGLLRGLASNLLDLQLATEDVAKTQVKELGPIRDGVRLLTGLVWALVVLIALLTVLVVGISIWKKSTDLWLMIKSMLP